MNDVARGQRAEELLNDPLMEEAFKVLEDAIQDTWQESTSSEERDKLWHILNGQKKFKEYFEILVENKDFDLKRLESKR